MHCFLTRDCQREVVKEVCLVQKVQRETFVAPCRHCFLVRCTICSATSSPRHRLQSRGSSEQRAVQSMRYWQAMRSCLIRAFAMLGRLEQHKLNQGLCTMLGRIGAGNGAAEANMKESGSNSAILRVLKQHARFLQRVPQASVFDVFLVNPWARPSCYASKVLYERCTAMANTLCPAKSSCVQGPIPAKKCDELCGAVDTIHCWVEGISFETQSLNTDSETQGVGIATQWQSFSTRPATSRTRYACPTQAKFLGRSRPHQEHCVDLRPNINSPTAIRPNVTQKKKK